MTDESEKMARELNEALDIEENASHTQRLITIVRLRTRALKEHETLLELEEVTRQRDQAEQRLLDVLAAHADFIQGAMTQAERLRKITEDFQKGVISRMSGSVLDGLDLALAKMREQRGKGELFSFNEVAEEFSSPLDEDDFRHVEETEETDLPGLDPLNLVDLEPKPQVRMDFPDTHEKRIGSETNTDFVDERNRVPFSDVDVALDPDTRSWMQKTAAGGARDEG